MKTIKIFKKCFDCIFYLTSDYGDSDCLLYHESIEEDEATFEPIKPTFCKATKVAIYEEGDEE